MDALLDKIVSAVSESDDLESLVRPLLSLLEAITGLESTYLTTIDAEHNVQRVLFALNTEALQIPEGIEVPWGNTLCKRALDEGHGFENDVQARWSDSDPARELGITTYMSEPVYVAEGSLHGTLCGASRSKVHVSEDTRRLLQMFSRLIARQVEREQLLVRLKAQNLEYSRYALTDPLTGIANRRALIDELGRALASAERTSSVVHVAFLDLDGFKSINDDLGHDAGDRFLIAIANVLANGIRDGDFVARYGGDEFVVFGSGAYDTQEVGRAALRDRIASLTKRRFSLGDDTVDYGGASVGVVTSDPNERDVPALLARADAAMYETKNARRSSKP